MPIQCPTCHQYYEGYHQCPGIQPWQPPQITAPTMGCICPPGANKDCENPICPRRNPFKDGLAGSSGIQK